MTAPFMIDWENPKEERTAPIDPAVRVIRIDHEREGPKAILVHYSCEPAVLGPVNQEVSADFPGAMSRYVEGEFGRGVLCSFFRCSRTFTLKPGLDGPEGFSAVAKMGHRFGREALRVSRSVGPSEWENQLRAENRFSRSEIAGILLAKWK